VDEVQRSHEKDFDEFAETVIRELRTSASVGAGVTAGARHEFRDIRFSAARPIAQENWVNAVRKACDKCCLSSDQRTWAMV
jgi:hypothetical protein